MATHEENKFVLEYRLRNGLESQEMSSLADLIGKHWRKNLSPVQGVLQGKRVKTDLFQSDDGEVLVTFRSYDSKDGNVKLLIDISSPRY